MRMRRHEHSEEPMNIIRSMLAYGTTDAIKGPKKFLGATPVVSDSLFEALNGKKARVQTSACRECGTAVAQKIEIPRHPKEPISRCPECGHNAEPGKNTVRGSTNYTGSPGSSYDEDTQ